MALLLSLLARTASWSAIGSLAWFWIFSSTEATPIPNGILGLPEIECGQNSIDIVFNLQDNFNGKIYVQGFANDSRCVAQERGRRTTSISIPKDGCGVTSLRSANPSGLVVSVKVLISFHPLFVTKVDRGFELSCFYMEVDKTATYPLTVNTVGLEPITELAEMPRCIYQVLEGSPTGKPATVVTVGDALYHKWNCISSAPDLWCMTVHSCYVEDGSGTRVEILTNDGCAVDKYILNNLEYQSPLAAGQEAHAFKFADKIVINFQCSIRLDIKRGECKRPKCPKLRRRRRSFANGASSDHSDDEWAQPPAADIDVRSRSIDVIDPVIDASNNDRSSIDAAIFRLKSKYLSTHCLSYSALIVPTSICLVISLSAIVIVIVLTRHRRKFEHS